MGLLQVIDIYIGGKKKKANTRLSNTKNTVEVIHFTILKPFTQ